MSAFSDKSTGPEFQESSAISIVIGVAECVSMKASFPIIDSRSEGQFYLSQLRFCFLIFFILTSPCHV